MSRASGDHWSQQHGQGDIQAREVAVMGSVKGNIHCSDLVDLRAESNIQGEIVTRRTASTTAPC